MKEIERRCQIFTSFLRFPIRSRKTTGKEIGLITDVVDRYLSEQGDDVAREGYLCGSPGMINACIDVLTKHKITEEKIYYDKFG
jgi:Na+-transporting NADH:ubiquinone oxidoreductase subunit F